MSKDLDRQLAEKFIDKKINNKKGKTFPERFIDILSDPSNLFIDRCEEAGKVVGDNVVMHNGTLVPLNCYYGHFSKIFIMNKGAHEPAEERMFAEVLEHIPAGGTIIELGAYWAFYSMWFYKKIPDAKVFCIEPNRKNREIGINNCKINNVKANFAKGKIGNDGLSLKKFISNNGIGFVDILHSDIQGSEVMMLEDISPLLDEQKIGYLFVSTHSQELHNSCVEILDRHDYRIVASADVDDETFCFDGIIVSCHKDNLDIPYTSLGCRKHTPLRKTYEWDDVDPSAI